MARAVADGVKRARWLLSLCSRETHKQIEEGDDDRGLEPPGAKCQIWTDGEAAF